MRATSEDFYFEDFKVGDRFMTQGISVTESMIVQFALLYDPQPMHMDRVAAEKGAFGGLIASGLHTLSLTARLLVDLGVFRACNLGSAGIDELRWVAPVRADDRLHAELQVLSARVSASKPDRGVLGLMVTTYQQDGKAVLTYKNTTLVKVRSAQFSS